MELINGLSNRQCFINLITEKGNQQHLANFLRDLKNVEDYDDGFKLFHAYKKAYKERLTLFIDEYNGHTNELKFISQELLELKTIRLYPFSIMWDLDNNKDKIHNKFILLWPFPTDEDDIEFMEDEYFDTLNNLFFLLNEQQSKIIQFLNEIKEYILKSDPSFAENIIESSTYESFEEIDDPLRDGMANKLRLLYHLGVLDFLKEKYEGERSEWGKLLNKVIGHENPESVGKSVIDFFKDRDNKDSKSDFRLGYDSEKIIQFISGLLREK